MQGSLSPVGQRLTFPAAESKPKYIESVLFTRPSLLRRDAPSSLYDDDLPPKKALSTLSPIQSKPIQFTYPQQASPQVTVFGYPQHLTNEVLARFKLIGQCSQTSIPSQSNFMQLTYTTQDAANRALALSNQPLSPLHPGILIGVFPGIPNALSPQYHQPSSTLSYAQPQSVEQQQQPLLRSQASPQRILGQQEISRSTIQPHSSLGMNFPQQTPQTHQQINMLAQARPSHQNPLTESNMGRPTPQIQTNPSNQPARQMLMVRAGESVMMQESMLDTPQKGMFGSLYGMVFGNQ